MPALYPVYLRQVCGNSHTLSFAGLAPSPDTSWHFFYTCDVLPVAMRITGADRWKPVKRKPDGASTVHGAQPSNRVES